MPKEWLPNMDTWYTSTSWRVVKSLNAREFIGQKPMLHNRLPQLGGTEFAQWMWEGFFPRRNTWYIVHFDSSERALHLSFVSSLILHVASCARFCNGIVHCRHERVKLLNFSLFPCWSWQVSSKWSGARVCCSILFIVFYIAGLHLPDVVCGGILVSWNCEKKGFWKKEVFGNRLVVLFSGYFWRVSPSLGRLGVGLDPLTVFCRFVRRS